MMPDTEKLLKKLASPGRLTTSSLHSLVLPTSLVMEQGKWRHTGILEVNLGFRPDATIFCSAHYNNSYLCRDLAIKRRKDLRARNTNDRTYSQLATAIPSADIANQLQNSFLMSLDAMSDFLKYMQAPPNDH